jgi:hypothetical protein
MINQTSSLVHGWHPTTIGLPGPAKLLAKPPGTRSGVIEAVARRVLGRAPTAQERAGVNRLLAGTKLPGSFGGQSWAREETIALTTIVMMCSPTFLSR